MKPPRQPLYLARQSYRRRRMMDAARLLPILGLFLLMLPLFWVARAEPTMGTAGAGLYMFTVWLVLIVAAFVVARRLAWVTGAEEEAANQTGAAHPSAGGGEGE